MMIVDAGGLPPSVGTAPANPHESQLVQSTVDFMIGERLTEGLVGDKAYDSDKLDA